MAPASALATTPRTIPVSRTTMLTPRVVKLCAAKRDRLPQDRAARQVPELTRYDEAPRQQATAITIGHRSPGGAAAWLVANAKLSPPSARIIAPKAASGSTVISAVSAAVRLQRSSAL